MSLFVGLDVSQRLTHICVVDADGRRVWRGKCATDPMILAETIRTQAGSDARVGVETGPLTPWLVHALRDAGVDMICIEARHAHAVMAAAQVNKNDRHDAQALAQLVRTGWYRAVHVKSYAAHQLRAALGARAQLVRMVTRVAPMLATWRYLRSQVAAFDRQLLAIAKIRPECRLLMSVPGVGYVSALAFIGAIDTPERFARSRAVGAHLGLVPKQHQSGDIDRLGEISKCGDAYVRTVLVEAANSLLIRCRKPSPLRAWALALEKRSGPKKARTALARKLAVIMHSVWRSGKPYAATLPAATAA